jgi:hypothetical protein
MTTLGRFPLGGIFRSEWNFSLSFLDKGKFRSAQKIPPSGKQP